MSLKAVVEQQETTINSEEELVELLETDREYQYKIGGVTISGNVPLTDDVLQSLYEDSIATTGENIKSDEGNTSIMEIPGGGNTGKITHGPVKTVSNPAGWNVLINEMIAWFTGTVKVKPVVKKSVWSAHILGKLEKWIPSFNIVIIQQSHQIVKERYLNKAPVSSI